MMLWLSALLVLAGTQPGDPYDVQDPFALEESAPVQAPAETAPPAAAPQTESAAEPSPDALICRSRPALGSRTRYYRTCMTAVQWEHHETNMEQQRRDINDMGAAGCDKNYVSSGCFTSTGRPGT